MKRGKHLKIRNFYSYVPDDEKQCSFCIGKNGEAKRLYSSAQEAAEVARHQMSVNKVSLKEYPCPYGAGWHLTSG
ncbi:MAG: hypothetical protein FWE23_07640 [Chitinivibrionia bacterium]|nr:hypothetical protein [Chitinivibrionia bacterium]